MLRALPNLLTLYRLAAAPGLALAYLAFDRPVADALALALFTSASITDWLDGKLARAWQAESDFGRMMDPIADKAMVVIALVIVVMHTGPSFISLIPAVAILFREVAVSGLREFLAGREDVPVSRLAKWKTGVQMVALCLLFGWSWADARVQALMFTLGPPDYMRIRGGEAPDELGLVFADIASQILPWAGFALLWAAAALTLVTGYQYFRMALAPRREA
ncbi:MAG: CDP-diacylglycerol--glycerol-3-phosphate 3-phosphatidyltransferase [Pseudomonadota bacterium]